MYIDYFRLEWEKVSKRSYLQRIPSIKKTNGMRFNAPVTFFVGENGSGKSTLLEAIAVAYGFNPEGGSYNYRFSTFDDHSNLHNAVVLGRWSMNLAKEVQAPCTGRRRCTSSRTERAS